LEIHETNHLEMMRIEDTWNELSTLEKRKLLDLDRPDKIKIRRSHEEPTNHTYYNRYQGKQNYSVMRNLHNVRADITIGQLIEVCPAVREELNQASTSKVNIKTMDAQSRNSNCKTIVTVNGVKYQAVVDTGAACSIISRGLAQLMKMQNTSTTSETIVTADGANHQIKYKVVGAPITINGKEYIANLLILEIDTHSLVLVTDWLKLHGAIINMNNSTLSLPKDNTELQKK
ncbi:hypothetical protein AX774_g6195, partial [Zancudomyces culisetae]